MAAPNAGVDLRRSRPAPGSDPATFRLTARRADRAPSNFL
jgi:hypothetical protein